MAQKRMFTMKIVDSDAFLDMPLSTQCLYFHLNMRADDDGFIGNSKRIMQLIGASSDDMKLLIMKRFVLVCNDDGVIVIKHWRMHNTLSRNRYTETSYTDEKHMLFLKENGSYSLSEGELIDDTKLIESSEKQIKKVRNNKEMKIEIEKVIEAWNSLREVGITPIRDIKQSSKRYQLLKGRIREYGIDEVLSAIKNIRDSDFLRGENNRCWIITFDWFVKPNNFLKVLEGNYSKEKKNGTDRKAQRNAEPIISPDRWNEDGESNTPFV